MEPLLLLVDRDRPALQAVHRALMLARYLGQNLELMLFDDGRTPFDPGVQPVESARRFLDALRLSFDAPDVPLTTDMQLGGRLLDGLRARHRPHQLVIRPSPGNAQQHGAVVDFELLRDSPSPVYFTPGLPWRTPPRISAQLPCGVAGDAPTNDMAAALCERLRLACGAETAWPQTFPMGDAHTPQCDVAIVPVTRYASFIEFFQSEVGRMIRASRCDVLALPRGYLPALSIN